MLHHTLQAHIDTLIERYPVLAPLSADIEKAYLLLEECYQSGGKLLVAGNGGSCADGEHIVGELMKGFKRMRTPAPDFQRKLTEIDPVRGKELAAKLQGGLPAIALSNHAALSSAYINDVENGGLLTYAQQVYGYGKAGDVLLGISTSGNSKNVMHATVVARALGMKVIALTGAAGGALASVADVTLRVPEAETYMVQELHLPLYHALCLMLEDRFFGERS